MSTSSKSVEMQAIRFLTEDDSIVVPPTEIKVAANTKTSALRKLVNIIPEDNGQALASKLKFIANGCFLRGSLDAFLAKTGSDKEEVLRVHCIRCPQMPEPYKSLKQKELVPGVAVKDSYVLSACYDGTVSIFDLESGTKILSTEQPDRVISVAWVTLNEDYGTFVAAGHDQDVVIYKWNVKENRIECENSGGRCHAGSIHCLAVSPDCSMIASGSWDQSVKIWSSKLDAHNSFSDDKLKDKKSRQSAGKPVDRTPIRTLTGHVNNVSGVCWTPELGVMTSSYDHTIKIWDLETGGVKSELAGKEVLYGLAYSSLNRTIAAASGDGSVRVFDPRSKDLKARYTKHDDWVYCVDWCRTSENLLLSSGGDGLLKMWDVRSHRFPLYDLRGHVEEVFSCSWEEPKAIVSGGKDGLKIFKTNL